MSNEILGRRNSNSAVGEPQRIDHKGGVVVEWIDASGRSSLANYFCGAGTLVLLTSSSGDSFVIRVGEESEEDAFRADWMKISGDFRRAVGTIDRELELVDD